MPIFIKKGLGHQLAVLVKFSFGVARHPFSINFTELFGGRPSGVGQTDHISLHSIYLSPSFLFATTSCKQNNQQQDPCGKFRFHTEYNCRLIKCLRLMPIVPSRKKAQSLFLWGARYTIIALQGRILKETISDSSNTFPIIGNTCVIHLAPKAQTPTNASSKSTKPSPPPTLTRKGEKATENQRKL